MKIIFISFMILNELEMKHLLNNNLISKVLLRWNLYWNILKIIIEKILKYIEIYWKVIINRVTLLKIDWKIFEFTLTVIT